jgi:hypothetical protein
VGASNTWETGLIISSTLALIYGGLGWLFSRNELDGRPFWIFGMSSLAVAGAVRALPFVSQAWGLALLISGGILFLFSTRRLRYIWLPALGLFSISGLPFTPLWRGMSLFVGWNLVYSILFSMGISFLILGYFRHSFRVIDSGDEIESWARILYPVGLVLLPTIYIGLAWFLKWFHPSQMGLQSVVWWLGALISILVSVTWYLIIRRTDVTSPDNEFLRLSFSLRWLYRVFWGIYRSTSRLATYLSDLMEGEGGIFWTVLIMILLVTVIVQRSGGG